MGNEKVTKGGISFCGLFFLILFVLKVAKIGAVANWSWWWITAPLWGGFALGLAILLFSLALGLLVAFFEK